MPRPLQSLGHTVRSQEIPVPPSHIIQATGLPHLQTTRNHAGLFHHAVKTRKGVWVVGPIHQLTIIIIEALTLPSLAVTEALVGALNTTVSVISASHGVGHPCA